MNDHVNRIDTTPERVEETAKNEHVFYRIRDVSTGVIRQKLTEDLNQIDSFLHVHQGLVEAGRLEVITYHATEAGRCSAEEFMK